MYFNLYSSNFRNFKFGNFIKIHLTYYSPKLLADILIPLLHRYTLSKGEKKTLERLDHIYLSQTCISS